MKFGIIRERKNPPDRRVVFSPEELLQLKNEYPEAQIAVESSDIRIFPDQAYRDLGFEVTDDMTDCDVLFGVKEVPVDALIPNKKYFFFSHTIKRQPYNQKLLRAILDKNIALFDHETIVDKNNKRLIGFGRYAGIVGAYNAFRTFGIKFELFNLAKAETLPSMEALVERLRRPTLPPIKIVLTGHGKVGSGAKEILDAMNLKEVAVEDFLKKNYSQAVYTQIDVMDYYKTVDGSERSKSDFYKNPSNYTSDFSKFANVADILIAGHFHANGSPNIVTQEMLAAKGNKIQVIADISCDVGGPIAATIKASTIADPIFGYLASENKEVDKNHPGAISVMSVDNLPCELPKDASIGFGHMFLDHVIPAFFNGDKDGILERAKMTDSGKLTPRFEYLKDYAEGSK